MKRVPPPRRPRPTTAPPPTPGLGSDSLDRLSPEQVSARATQAQQRTDASRRTSQARAMAERTAPARALAEQRAAAAPPPAPVESTPPPAVQRVPTKPTPPDPLDFTPAELDYIGGLVREDQQRRRDPQHRPPYARF